MDYDTFMRRIACSFPDDWIGDDEHGICILKSDLLITIQREEKDELEVFQEDWAMKFPDRIAYKQRFFLRYGESVIESVYTASVDGNRAYIPYPNVADMTITKFQYNVARIVNECFSGKLEEYLSRSGIQVCNDSL